MKMYSRKYLWDKTPHQMKSALGGVFGLIPLSWWLGKRFRKYRWFVQQAQWWQKERVREYQLKKLREIITLAYTNTEFYHKTFDSVGFHPSDMKMLEDIQHLATIDKETVNDNLMDMYTRSVKESDVDYVSTGGTTGKPLQFYINSGRSSIEYAYLVSSWERAGYDLGMPMAVLRGRTIPSDRTEFHYEYDPILRHHYYSNFHMSDKDKEFYLEHIRNLGPCVLHAYPSSAATLARFLLEKRQQKLHNICGILLESENVYSDQICAIEEAFSTHVFSSYGHSEKLVLAAQCEFSDAYHVWPTYGYFELVDENGKVIKTAGQEGEIVGTGFINTIVPFVRYRTGDYATYVDDHCELCGREHVIITRIRGRDRQESLIATDGSPLPVIGLHPHDDTFRSIREYQFHQTEPGTAILCVVPSNTLDENEQRRIIANMDKRFQGQLTLSIQIMRELEKTTIGKQPRVIQKCLSSQNANNHRRGVL